MYNVLVYIDVVMSKYIVACHYKEQHAYNNKNGYTVGHASIHMLASLCTVTLI